jgi:hypothetical protein
VINPASITTPPHSPPPPPAQPPYADGVRARVYAFLREHADQELTYEHVANAVDASVSQVQNAVWARRLDPEAAVHLALTGRGVVTWHSSTTTRPTPVKRRGKTRRPYVKPTVTLGADTTQNDAARIIESARVPADAVPVTPGQTYSLAAVALTDNADTSLFVQVGELPDGRILLHDRAHPLTLLVAELYVPVRPITGENAANS